MAGLTDEQMAQLEAQHAPKKGLTDEEMAQLEAGAPKAEYQSPGGDGFMARVSDPNRWKAIAGMESPARPEMTTGHAPLAMPIAQAPAALAGLASYLGSSGVGPALGRIAANTGIGGLQGGKEGAMMGAGLGIASEAVQPALSVAKWGGRQLARMTAPEAKAYTEAPAKVAGMARALEDPTKMPELQDQAVEAINQSRRALKMKGLQDAGRVREALSGKHVEINPQELAGLSSEADEILSPLGAKIHGNPGEKVMEENVLRTVGATPDKQVLTDAVSIPANDANALKRYLQKAARFVQGTVTDPVQQARMAKAGSASAQVRSGIEQVAPEVAALNEEMQQGLMLQQALRNGAKNNPLSFVSSHAPDRVATLARAEQAGGGGLLDFGNQLGAAKTMTRPDQGSGIPTFGVKLGGRALLRAADSAQHAKDVSPVATQELIRRLFGE